MDKKDLERNNRPRSFNRTITESPTIAAASGVIPEYSRLPKPPRSCPHSGLNRSAMNRLVLGPNPKVKSVLLKEPGTARGIRLVHVPSLLAHLAAEMDAQSNGEGGRHD